MPRQREMRVSQITIGDRSGTVDAVSERSADRDGSMPDRASTARVTVQPGIAHRHAAEAPFPAAA
jgi:hypothetical protein